ncbi:centrosome-associated protein CEP250-like isoform X2 [Hemicordylus capensis]|uniref:centrosome-associated protein CEP250-like isoform X2 n=1 Tax=Hemicordylus capensis TaxID=884348 RepID=UPI0023044158|nr:centrosome-associated protein CEP250-like isoform X2 [Hemicordylus capensis]
MGSFLKLGPSMERDAQHSVSGKDRLVETLTANRELHVQVEKMSKMQAGSISSPQDLYSLLSQSEHSSPGKIERLHQGSMEGGSQRKQKEFRMLMWELGELQQKLSQQKEEHRSLRQSLSEENQALKEEVSKLEAQHTEKMEEQEKQQQELATAVKALREAESKIANLASECQEALAKKEAAEKSLEEAEQRLSFQETERRKHLADTEAQELRHQHVITRCQSLQEKLKVCEESLEKWETQVVALQCQHGQLETTEEEQQGLSCKPAEREEHPSTIEMGLLREKLKRSLAETEALERERETLMETLVSREQSLVFTKLEMQDLQKELSGCQEHVVTFRMSLEEQEKVLRDREKVLQGLQEHLKDQSTQLQEALEKNTTLNAQLEEIASKKSQLEAQGAEERARMESILQEQRNQLGTFEKEVTKLQEERQQLQVTVQQALEEGEALVKQVKSTTAALEEQTQEATQLRSELHKVQVASQTLQKALQEKSEVVASALRGECLQLKNQVEQLELEKMQAISIAEKLSIELGQCWEWPTEESALQSALAPSTTVLDLAIGIRGEESRSLAKERGIADDNSHGVAGSWLTKREVFQADVLQNLNRVVKGGGSTKHSTEVDSKHLTDHLDNMMGDIQQVKQMLLAKEKMTKQLMEQLSRSQQDKEQLQLLLDKSHQELEGKEKKYKEELSEQGDLICSMKGKLLELLREKDALWQKTEGIASSAVCPAPQHSGGCAYCKKDFRLMSRRYQCRLPGAIAEDYYKEVS